METQVATGLAWMPMLSTLAYTVLGLVIYLIAFWLICKVSPFSVRKEIEIDQNTALGIIIGAVMLGLSIIIASAMH
ncbi:MAG: DUF350 domain-containing protein [Candidatus Rifleibacteriota bacterium]